MMRHTAQGGFKDGVHVCWHTPSHTARGRNQRRRARLLACPCPHNVGEESTTTCMVGLAHPCANGGKRRWCVSATMGSAGSVVCQKGVVCFSDGVIRRGAMPGKGCVPERPVAVAARAPVAARAGCGKAPPLVLDVGRDLASRARREGRPHGARPHATRAREHHEPARGGLPTSPRPVRTFISGGHDGIVSLFTRAPHCVCLSARAMHPRCLFARVHAHVRSVPTVRARRYA